MTDVRPRALVRIDDRARARHIDALTRLAAVLGAVSEPDQRLAALTEGVRRHGRITLNFHPDRPTPGGATVIEGMSDSGRYQSLWETGWSNGSRSGVAGGQRESFEAAYFGADAFDGLHDRPLYGALDLTHDPHGGAPRFGSCFLVLAPHCFERSTFSVGDSHLDPADRGTIETLSSVLAGTLERAKLGTGLGRALDLDALLQTIEHGAQASQPSRVLDGYVEAQVHAGVSLADDVTAIIADPSFCSTDIETSLETVAARYDCDLAWHPGSSLTVADVPDWFRGPEIVALADQIAGPSGTLDAAQLGRAVRQLPRRSGTASWPLATTRRTPRTRTKPARCRRCQQ